MNYLSAVLLLLLWITQIHAENILFYSALGAYSSRLSVWPLVESLVEKGHKVAFLSNFQPRTPNPKVVDITPKVLLNSLNNMSGSVIDARLKGLNSEMWDELMDAGISICENILNEDATMDWIKKSKFDLVLVDTLFNDCGYGLAYYWKAKVAIMSTCSPAMWYPDIFGHVLETSWIPDMIVQFPQKMTFFQRVEGTLQPLYWNWWKRYWTYFPRMEEILRRKLQIPDMPALKELEKNASLILINSHASSEYARSLPPVYVSVGGMHITPTRDQLSKEIENFMEESGDKPIIYVSFGSFAQASDFPTDLKQEFYDAFKNCLNGNVRYIWKWNADRPNDMPTNILTIKWAPQQKILEHPKLRAFISHSGLLGTQEAIFHSIPLIMFPIFGDQDYNAEVIHSKGLGIKLEIVGLKSQALCDAITKVMVDKSYQTRMAEASKLFRDRPEKPVDLAVWWLEYVLRHDTAILKPLGVNQYWFERRLLDVWLFIAAVISSVIALLIFIICKCFYPNNDQTKSNILKKKKK